MVLSNQYFSKQLIIRFANYLWGLSIGLIPFVSFSQDPPENMQWGVNVLDSTVVFQLFAPGKSQVHLLTAENQFLADSSFSMNQSQDGNVYWIELPKDMFDDGHNTYQYLVDRQLAVADPFSELVLDPVHDGFVPFSARRNLPNYPLGASGVVSIIDLDREPYVFNYSDVKKPPQDQLVIYELLIRDFLADHSYSSLIDTLDYLEKLGINAIELMPIHEFEGNISWGYNPSFHLAVDKYYGSREELKAFVDEAHRRGMAVILDVVFNHVFSQSPLARMYWDEVNNRPAADNPFLNSVPRHPFNVGFDVNHESEATKVWVKRSLEQWIQEYQFDGFRFDLSKGLTQTFSGEDEGLMSQYDETRIEILKEYADYIWSLDSSSYVILEHFADLLEERELANYGMMLWGNMNFEFAEAAMGYRSNLEWADYSFRGFSEPHLIPYMESHDEERIMYKILQFGNSANDYNTQDETIALKRIEAISALYYTLPGPKMLWQFGELGYDFPINYCPDGTINPSCRVDPKPIRWDYLSEPGRAGLLDRISSFIQLRTQFPTFSTKDFSFNDANDYVKRLKLNHPEMDVVVIVNFNVVEATINPFFHREGTWYDFVEQDSISVTDVNTIITLQPGEYRMYTSKRVVVEERNISTSLKQHVAHIPLDVYPNPVAAGDALFVSWDYSFRPTHIHLSSLIGTDIPLAFSYQTNGISASIPSYVSKGIYFLQLEGEERIINQKIIIR